MSALLKKPYRPHKYQKTAIKFMLEKSFCGLFLDPGLGKTSVALAAFKILRKQGFVRRMLVIAPLRPALSTWPRELAKWEEFYDLSMVVLHGPNKLAMYEANADIYVINPEGLEWFIDTARARKDEWLWDMLVVDECFPAGTRVSTLIGDEPIEDIQPGEYVHTSAGLRRVLECGTRVVDALVRLHLTDGRTLDCTPEHPVFTDLGWVPAKYAQGRLTYGESDLPQLRGDVPGAVLNDAPQGAPEVLWEVLRSEHDVGAHDREAAGEHPGGDVPGQPGASIMEQGQTVVEGAQGEDLRAGQGDGQVLYAEGGQRHGDVPLRDDGAWPLAEEVRMELRGRVGAAAARLSYELQAGLRGPGSTGGPGGGRPQPQELCAPGAGREEGRAPGGVRVARVEDLQRAGTTVYNLRVEGCPHFFAEDTLVHNSTRFKHTNTERFKQLKRVLPLFTRRYIMTGSPAPNGLMDLFGQFYVVDQGQTLGQYITHYRNTFFYSTGFGGYTYLPKEGAAQQIQARIGPRSLRMNAEDYLELPPLIENRVYVELPEKARKLYDQMETLLFAQIAEGQVISAVNAAAASMKCRQIANGGLYKGTEGKEWEQIHHAKLDATQDLVEELGGKPCLIAYEFKHDLERLREGFPGAPVLGGGMSAKKQREIEDAWNAGDIPILLAQPQSVAHGLNLQGVGAAIIFHSIMWDLEVMEQFIRRVWRQGQESRVVVHYVMAKQTVDYLIVDALSRKDKVQRSLMQSLKNYMKTSAHDKMAKRFGVEDEEALMAREE